MTRFCSYRKTGCSIWSYDLGLDIEEIEKRVRESLETVRLIGFEDRAPHHLSTGEKKKVAIAGILAMQPRFLFSMSPQQGLTRVVRYV